MKKTFLFVGYLLFLSIICFYACSKSASGTSNTASAENKVSIANFAFSVSSLTVPVGTTVTWTNNDNTTHTVTADNGSFNSGNLISGATFSMTFAKPGTYAYHCNIHPMMVANVVVQ